MEPLSVLLINADPTFRQLLTQFLLKQREVGTIHTASHGNEALERVEQTRPDLVLIDLFTPLQEGLNAIVNLRKRFPKMCIIVLSLQNEEAYGEAFLEAGADAFVDKMNIAKELPSVLRQVMQKLYPEA